MTTNTVSITEKTGDIRIAATKRGMTLKTFNFQRGEYVSIGSVRGQVYEKQGPPVKIVAGEFDPSFALTVDELYTALELGATILRVIYSGETYAIALKEYNNDKHARRYSNSYYGEQVAISTKFFDRSGTTKKRNAVLDNPKGAGAAIFEKPQAEQLPMFQPRPTFDEFGNLRGER